MKIIFFGDSICFGQGVSLSKIWVSQIAAQLEKQCTFDVTVVNTALNGRTTRQALEHMPHEVQSQSPDFLVVQYGLNDCNIWLTDRGLPRVSRAAFKANLQEIINRGVNFGAKKVLLNTNHPTLRNSIVLPNSNLTYQESNELYNETIREVASENKQQVILNDLELAIKKNCRDEGDLAKLLLSDQLHLSTEGHELYYKLVYPKVFGMITNHETR